MLCYKCRQDIVEGPRGGVYPSPGIKLCTLHAAAPALLEALEQIAAGLTNGQKERGETFQSIAHAAIAQTKGRDNG